MKTVFLVTAILLGGATAALSHLPLAWVAPHLMPADIGENISYKGTVWNGAISGLNSLGTARMKISPKAFIKGGLPLDFQTQSSAISLSGKASRSQFKDIRFIGQLAQLPTRDGRLKELAGEVIINVAELQFDKDCQSATGQIRTDFLARNESRWQWRGPVLSGPITCENGEMIVKLLGSEKRQVIKADLRLSFDGTYAADIAVQTDQPEAGVVMPLYGFEKVGREFKLTEQGQWR